MIPFLWRLYHAVLFSLSDSVLPQRFGQRRETRNVGEEGSSVSTVGQRTAIG
jgi:hypothetical protein